MEYNENLLKAWATMENWGDFLSRRGTLTNNVSHERFKNVEKEYFDGLKKRIDYCKKLLVAHKNYLIYYTLAELYDRYNVDESVEFLYKRPVRYYCIKALRRNRNYAPAWVLLSEAYEWIATLGGESRAIPKMKALVDKNIIVSIEQKGFLGNRIDAQNRAIRYIEKAIAYTKKALIIEPLNKKYQNILKGYYYQRNEEYR